MPGSPTPGSPTPGSPTPGSPTPGSPTPGSPTPGSPTPGSPTPGSPTPGSPTPGSPTHGGPVPGSPTPGSPTPGSPTHGSPTPGSPTHGGPTHGGPVRGATMPGRVLPPLVAVLVLLGIWELYVDLGGADPLFLPAPHAVAAALYDQRAELLSNFWVTSRELVLGILAGVLVAVALAVTIHFSGVLRRALYPLLIASQAVPVVLVAVLLVIWLGFSLASKVVIIGLVSFFPVVVTTLAALEATDPELIKLMRTFGASRIQIFRHIEAPAALPGLFTGMKLAAVASVTGAVFAEQSGCNNGLGCLFTISVEQLQAPVAFAAVTLLVAFAVVVFAVLSLAERRLLPWAHRNRR
jgi:putative hydroxymethylpyrimidine transport system permease protein